MSVSVTLELMASSAFVVLVLLSFSATALAVTFDYHLSGQDWTDACATGQRQSPINIVKKDASDEGTSESFGLNYVASMDYTIRNSGHVIEVTPLNASNNKLTLRDGSVYKLLQFHFHGFSEHAMDGLFSPLEVHFVHQSEDDPLKFAVVGALLRVDPDEADNDWLEDIIENIPSTVSNQTVTGPSVVWSDFLLAATKKSGSGGGGGGSSKGPIYRVYTYLGSLTTPGCNEVVEWFVLAKPQYASTAQAIKFYDAVAAVSGGVRVNNRLPQKMNGRNLATFLAHKNKP